MSFRFAAALLLSVLWLPGCNQTTTVEPDRQLVIVQGTGEVRAVPDRFRVLAVAVSRGQEVDRLRRDVDEQVQRVLALANQLGLEKGRVNARELSIQPEWEHEPKRRISGYSAERPVELTVESTAQLARLMNGLTEAGITRIQSLGASISNLAEVERDALAHAVEDARGRAQAMAEAAGRTLGPVVHMAEQGGRGPGPMMRMEAMSDAGGAWEAGEQLVRQTVEVRFALE